MSVSRSLSSPSCCTFLPGYPVLLTVPLSQSLLPHAHQRRKKQEKKRREEEEGKKEQEEAATRAHSFGCPFPGRSFSRRLVEGPRLFASTCVSLLLCVFGFLLERVLHSHPLGPGSFTAASATILFEQRVSSNPRSRVPASRIVNCAPSGHNPGGFLVVHTRPVRFNVCGEPVKKRPTGRLPALLKGPRPRHAGVAGLVGSDTSPQSTTVLRRRIRCPTWRPR